MAVISDLGGTSNNSFSINGKVTLFQGDDLPNPLMGNNGDVYFKSEGLLYIKRNGVWEEWTKDSVPDARSYQNRLLYSNGENYDFTEITYNADANQPHQLELINEPNADTGTLSKIIPNIGWINNSLKNNLLHKSGDETKTDILSLKNKNGVIGNNSVSSNELKFIDNNNTLNAYVKNILNSIDGSSVTNNTSILELGSIAGLTKSKIQIVSKQDGTSYITVPTPSANASNNEVVNAEWTNNVIDDVKDQINDVQTTVNDSISTLSSSSIKYPSYTSGSDLENSGTFSQDGWVCCNGINYAGGTFYFYVNSIEIVAIGSMDRDGSHEISCVFPVKSGDTYSKTNNLKAVFFPNR